MSWTEDRIETLKKMWGEGQSASQIAKELGGVTRNAVIGKVHRLGLSNRAVAGATASGSADAAPVTAAQVPPAAPAREADDAPAAGVSPAATPSAGTPAKGAPVTDRPRPGAMPGVTARDANPAPAETATKPARAEADGVVDLARAKAARAEVMPEPEDDLTEDTPDATGTGVGPSAPGSYARRAIVPAGQPLPPQPSANEISPEALATVREVEKTARRLTLMELTERTCKWPIGDPATQDFWFCGLPTQAGKPYCEAHVGVAFQPMSTRRDRRR